LALLLLSGDVALELDDSAAEEELSSVTELLETSSPELELSVVVLLEDSAAEEELPAALLDEETQGQELLNSPPGGHSVTGSIPRKHVSSASNTQYSNSCAEELEPEEILELEDSLVAELDSGLISELEEV
jgi:hypothetical protein